MERNRLDVATEPCIEDSIHSVLVQLHIQISALQTEVKNLMRNDADLRHKHDPLIIIQGISDKKAALLLAELGDPLSFTNVRKIVAFAGLNQAGRIGAA